jgi:DNA invertase Pin-like site-specific DNA recombinase
MVAGIFASLAEYERTLINERAAAARDAARARGKPVGRKHVLSPEQVALAKRMRASGESISTLVETLGASRATIYRVLSES